MKDSFEASLSVICESKAKLKSCEREYHPLSLEHLSTRSPPYFNPYPACKEDNLPKDLAQKELSPEVVLDAAQT